MSYRKTIEIEIRGDNIKLGAGWETLEKGKNLFIRIENTLMKKDVAHNLTSIDSQVNGFYCCQLTITYNKKETTEKVIVKTYKKFSTAKKNSKGSPIIRVGPLYIIGVDPIDSIEIVRDDGHITGTVTPRHLDRLGNANHASLGRVMPEDSYDHSSLCGG